jgi:short-subunit dehydrogenase
MSKNPIPRLSGLVVVTGASSGIGLELARRAGEDGCSLILAADRDLAEGAAAARTAGAASVETVEADLAAPEGRGALLAAIGERPVAALIANAGISKGGAYLDQRWDDVAHTVDTNITGTVALIHAIGREMLARKEGRILVTGSIVGDIPGPLNLVYNSTKAFLNDFCAGLAEEVRDTPLVVTCLLPGGTDTDFFEHAELEDTILGLMPKADPFRVARDGYQALLDGQSRTVSGPINKVLSVFADIVPGPILAEIHRRMAEPRSHERRTEEGASPA